VQELINFFAESIKELYDFGREIDFLVVKAMEYRKGQTII
jgi:hypothetical protein